MLRHLPKNRSGGSSGRALKKDTVLPFRNGTILVYSNTFKKAIDKYDEAFSLETQGLSN